MIYRLALMYLSIYTGFRKQTTASNIKVVIFYFSKNSTKQYIGLELKFHTLPCKFLTKWNYLPYSYECDCELTIKLIRYQF